MGNLIQMKNYLLKNGNWLCFCRHDLEKDNNVHKFTDQFLRIMNYK